MFSFCCGVRKIEMSPLVKNNENRIYPPCGRFWKKRDLEQEIARHILCFLEYSDWNRLAYLTKEENFLIPMVGWQKTAGAPVVQKNLAWVIYQSPSNLRNLALARHYTDRWMLKIFNSSSIPLQLPHLQVKIKKEDLGGFFALDKLWRKKESFFGDQKISIFQATWESVVPKAVLVWKVTMLWPKTKRDGSTTLDVWHDYIILDWNIFTQQWEMWHQVGAEGRPEYACFHNGVELIPKSRRCFELDAESLSWIQQLLKKKLVGAKIDLRKRYIREKGKATHYFPDLPMCLGYVSLKKLINQMKIVKERIPLNTRGIPRNLEKPQEPTEEAWVYYFKEGSRPSASFS